MKSMSPEEYVAGDETLESYAPCGRPAQWMINPALVDSETRTYICRSCARWYGADLVPATS